MRRRFTSRRALWIMFAAAIVMLLPVGGVAAGSNATPSTTGAGSASAGSYCIGFAEAAPPPNAAAAQVMKDFTKETGKPIEWDTVRNVCFTSLSAEHDYMHAHNLTVPTPPR